MSQKTKKISGKKILDACCGGRMFWFDKENPDVLFVDNRVVDPRMVGKGKNAREYSCQPDQVMDFRKLDLPDNHFYLVVFDPPHFTRAGEKSYMGLKYGKLDKKTWKEDLKKGFEECFRVLRPNGVLIFKWNETHIPVSKILPLSPFKPLFGHRSGARQLTHWISFLKPSND